MKAPKIDLLARRYAVYSGQRPRNTALLTSVLAVLVFAGAFFAGRTSQTAAAETPLTNTTDTSFFGAMSHLITSPDRKLVGEDQDRINILLLGIGGDGHDGPLLTDTMILASIKPSEHKVALLNIPRDILVPIPSFGWRKINAADAFGELKDPGHGGDASRAVAEGLLGVDIPYYVRVDFRGFTKFVDSLGGIDVYVDTSFTDRSYPTADNGYQTISFSSGWHHMDGVTALEFTRSRHGTNGESSDFARSRRQQKVLAAVKEKIVSSSTFLNPSAISNMLTTLQSNVTSNLQLGEMLRLARMATSIDKKNVTSKVIDDSPDSPLADGFFGGAFVLLPKNDDWTGVRKIADNLFDVSTPDAHVAEGSATASKATVEIRNGTDKNGLARTVAERAVSKGLKIVKIGNADATTYGKTIIYDLTDGKDPDGLTALKDTVGSSSLVLNTLPVEKGASTAQFVVILGTDSL